MSSEYSDLKGMWSAVQLDPESMQSITFKALDELISAYDGKNIPGSVPPDTIRTLKELLDKTIEVGVLIEELQEKLYCSVYVLSLASEAEYDGRINTGLNDFLSLREKLSSAGRVQLMSLEAKFICRIFDHAKSKVDADSIKLYLNECGEHERRLEEVKRLYVRVKDMEANLKKHEVAYNFVGLYKGFHAMREEKQRELDKQNKFVIWLGVAVVVPLVIKLADSLYHGGDKINIPLLITIGGLELILIYFFRIALHSANSIKAQLLQIDLRRTLCSFIQDYADYSKKIKEGNPAALDKFETLIFSGLVMQDDKLPSTFDGLEPIQKLLDRRP